MPSKPKRPCRYPRCGGFCDGDSTYCAKHKSLASVERGNATARGYDHRWQKARLRYLHTHPLCAECLRNGRVTAADVVDHIIPHKGDMKLFWDANNWQSLCSTCHNIKTASEDGGFGNPQK